MIALLAEGAIFPPYRPFIDPIQVHALWWLMLLPLAVGVSMVYKAVRMRDLHGYWLAVLRMTVEIVLGMGLLGVATYLVVEVYVRKMSGG